MDWNKILMKKARPVIAKLKTFPEVKAIVFGGSVGGGIADEHSDIDITAFVTKVPDEKSRKAVWGRQKKYFKVPHSTIDFFLVGDRDCDIFYQDISTLEDSVERFLKGSDWDEVTAHRLTRIVKIVYDPEGIVRGLQKRVEAYPKWLKEKLYVLKLMRVRGSVEKMNNMLKRGNWFLMDKLLSDCTADIVHVLYGLNSAYFTAEYWPRWFVYDVKKFRILPPRAYERLEEIVRLNNRTDLIEKVDAMNSMVNDLEVLYKRQIKLKGHRSKAATARHLKNLKKTYARIRHDL